MTDPLNTQRFKDKIDSLTRDVKYWKQCLEREREESKKLRKALLTSPCPFPTGVTVEECINADKCGCDNKRALDE